ncbi:MAG TPA: cytochrome c maturation protein CcmE [Thermoanaerobaculia bacterium]
MSNARRNRWFAIGALAVAAVAFVIIAAGNIGKNLVYYWTPTDLRTAGDKAIGATIRLGGLVAANSIVRGGGASALEFDVTDQKNVVHVKSTSVPPQLFREGIGVVVEGTMSPAGHFECTRLMVSHDNQYRAPKAGEDVDAEKLIETTKGIE